MKYPLAQEMQTPVSWSQSEHPFWQAVRFLSVKLKYSFSVRHKGLRESNKDAEDESIMA